MGFLKRNSLARSNSIPSEDKSDGRRASGASSEGRRASLARSTSKLSALMRSKSKDDTAPSSTTSKKTLRDLFFALPTEIQLQCLTHLDLPSLFSCRHSGRYFSQLINVNQSTLLRLRIKAGRVPPQVLALFPPPAKATQALRYLYQVQHRLVICEALAKNLVADYISVELLRRRTQSSRKAFSSEQRRLVRRLTPPLLTLYHFFEEWRSWMLAHAKEPDGRWHMPEDLQADKQQNLMRQYSDTQLLEAHQTYALLVAAYARYLRPPSYALGLERTVRGWTAKPPSKEALKIALAVGGLDTTARVLSRPTYAGKCKAVDTFLRGLDPGQTVKWRKNWATLLWGPFTPAYHGLDPPERLVYEDFAGLWMAEAGESIMERGIVEARFQIKTPVEFISEILGYDALHLGMRPVGLYVDESELRAGTDEFMDLDYDDSDLDVHAGPDGVMQDPLEEHEDHHEQISEQEQPRDPDAWWQ